MYPRLAARLLRDVRELVREESLSFTRSRRIRARAEDDIPSVGVGARAERPRGVGGIRIVMHANAAEIVVEPALEESPNR